MVMSLKYLLATAVLGLLQSSFNSAHADEAPQVTPAKVCHDTARYALPEIPWMGSFIYKVTIRAKDSRIEEVEISTVHGPDSISDRRIRNGLRSHIKQNYACDVPDIKGSFYLRLNFKHEVPALKEKLAALRASAASGASAASDDEMASIPKASSVFCTTMGRPEIPRFLNAKGVLLIHAIVEIKDGSVSLVDTKLKIGSSDQDLNRLFLESVTHAIRETYQCSGDHVFEQEFKFDITS
jgi:hypothetical protein